MGCGIMFPRDYILDGEGEGCGCSVEGLDRPCELVSSSVLPRTYLKVDQQPAAGSARRFHVCSVLRPVG